MATSSPVVAASAAKAATPAEAAAKLGATYPHEQMATRPLDLNPAHWYEAIKWHYDGGTLNWPMIIYIGLCHYWAVLGLTRLAVGLALRRPLRLVVHLEAAVELR